MPERSSVPPALPATTTVDWLLRHGAAAATPGALLGELCSGLVAEGLPLANAVLAIASLDPLVARTRIRWRRGDTRVVEEVQLHGMGLAEAPSVDGASLRLVLPGTRHEVEWSAERPTGFDSEEHVYLEAICLASAAPLQVVVERGVTLGLLQAYLGRRSAGRVLSGAVHRGTGEVIAALNDCCARLVGSIHPFGGEVLKFIGDGLLAIFPLEPRGATAACDAALAAVRAARNGMARLDQERTRAGLPPLPFGIGLHLGAVMYGNIGAPHRLDFTTIGPAVNVASRSEGLCPPLSCPVLISETVAARSTQPLAPLGQHRLRGTARPVALFTLPELAPH